jgi:hypothetical protein
MADIQNFSASEEGRNSIIRHALNQLLYLLEISLSFIICNTFVGFLDVIIPVNIINLLVFVIKDQCVYCEVGTDFLNI